MEILLGIILSILMEGYKKLSIKFGSEATFKSIYLGLFVIALGYTLLQQVYPISVDALKIFAATVFSAVGTYEVILKRVGPFLSLIKKKK